MDWLIYYATAPIRLFGRSRVFRWSLAALVALGGSFAAANWALERYAPADKSSAALLADLPAPPPLAPVSSASVVIAPVSISLAALRDALDTAAPREFNGNANSADKLLSGVDLGLAVTRGSMSVAGRPNVLTVAAPLTAAVHLSGKFAARSASQAGSLADDLAGKLGGQLGGKIGDLLNGDLGQRLGQGVSDVATRTLDQTTTLHGEVRAQSEPKLRADWRVEPNISAQLLLGKGAVSVAGLKIDMAEQARPFIEQAMNDQVRALEAQIRNDPVIERAAREQWQKLCRSIALGGGDTGLPRLWLEMRPVRMAAAQPQVDARNLVLTVGVQAETRITATETKPSCPFPAQLELVPPMDKGKLTVGLPIDLPLPVVGKLLEAQLTGRHFPEGKDAPVDVTVRKVEVAAAGERLLITLAVHAAERKTWFGLGANATVHVWGKPVLDATRQILRFADIELAVRSDAAYGLLSAAARAAAPYLTQALAENAAVDLKPFAADARKKVEALLASFRDPAPGVRVDAAVDDLRVTGIAFDAETLRVTAAAAGTVQVAASKLPKM